MLETTIAGSLPKPAWLAEPKSCWPAWRQDGAELERAKRDAALVWLKEQEAAGIDIVSDGEQFRVHFVHGFLEQIEGIDWARKTRWASATTATSWTCRRSPPRSDGAACPRRAGALHARLHRTPAEVHAAGPDDHLRHHRRPLRPPR